MPRLARLDAPGVLHHVIIRGIERKKIFRDQNDKTDFYDRLSHLCEVTQTRCYAWVLMDNHAHFLFRSGPYGISKLMQRLLTGYVVSFNHRYRRHGQLFQNRYKSIICQEDVYLKELVRYIHLNPIRAKKIPDLKELRQYRFSGHGVLMGQRKCEFQDDEFVLGLFSNKIKPARKQYHEFVRSGISEGRRPELVGGGLIRSLGGWKAIKSIRLKGMDRIKGDQRILGDSDFVQSMLSQAEERFERATELKHLGMDMNKVAEKVATLFGIHPGDIYKKGRQKVKSDARGLFCYWAVRELEIPLSEIARRLNMSPAGVGYASQRGETIAKKCNYRLIE